MLYARQLSQKKMAGTVDMWYFVLICVCTLLGSAGQKPGICLLSVGRDARQLCRKARGIIGSRGAKALGGFNTVSTSHFWGAWRRAGMGLAAKHPKQSERLSR